MVDIVLLAKAVVAGTLAAVVVMQLAALSQPRAWRTDVAWTWAVGAGVLVASGATDQWPHWPALEDRARLLTLVIPLTVVVETLAAATLWPGLACAMRLTLSALVAPLLLYDSVYLASHDGNPAEWPVGQAALFLIGLAVLVALVWMLLSQLQARTSTQTVMWLLVLDSVAAAITVMLSGYYRGGLLGLGLAGAIAGATAGGHVAQPHSTTGSLGMSVIGICSVVFIGRFFGSLSTGLAACLLLAPLLAWIVEFPRLRTVAPKWRTAARLACVGVALVVVVVVAQRRFSAASASPSRAVQQRH
jgi:hypothetical protein